MRGTPSRRGEIDEREQVLVDRVHAALAEQPHQVERATRGLRPLAGAEEGLVTEEAAVGDRLGDPDEVLHHHAAGAEIEVPDLAVPHLPARKPHRQSGGIEQRPGRTSHERDPTSACRPSRWRFPPALRDIPTRQAPPARPVASLDSSNLCRTSARRKCIPRCAQRPRTVVGVGVECRRRSRTGPRSRGSAGVGAPRKPTGPAMPSVASVASVTPW